MQAATQTRFVVRQAMPDQFEVWDRSIPDILACYDNEPMAQDHAKRAHKSWLKSKR